MDFGKYLMFNLYGLFGDCGEIDNPIALYYAVYFPIIYLQR